MSVLVLMLAVFLISYANAHRVGGKHTKHIDQLDFIEGGEALYFALPWGEWDEKDGDYGMII